MGDVDVICSLDEDLQICRYINFVELVELLKLGQMHFEHVNDFQRSRMLTAAAAWRRSGCRPQTNGSSATKQARRRNQLLRAWPDGSLSFQTWAVFRGADAGSWSTCSCSDQQIGIVSSARNLAESLLVRSDTTVVIGKADELKLEDTASTSPYSLTGNLTTRMPSEGVGIIAHSTYADPDCNPQRGMSLHVVLSTLLSRVIVAPYATERFFDLVTKLVGENTWATVTRAHQAPFERMRSAISGAYAPTACVTESAGCVFHGIAAS